MKRRKRAVVTTLLFSILLTVIPVGDNGQSMMQQCATADTVTGQKSVSASEYLNDTTALTASVITISNADGALCVDCQNTVSGDRCRRIVRNSF